MAGKRPEILDCCLLPRDKIARCLRRLRLALGRANQDECLAAIADAFREEKPETITEASPVVSLGLDYRIVNSLEKRGIETVGELCQVSRSYLLSLPNMGQVYVREIVLALKRHGLKLRDVSKFNDRV